MRNYAGWERVTAFGAIYLFTLYLPLTVYKN